ncbi:MAG: hypothetical protein KF751_02930 [Nitrospira sp.]|nr:hypothetical protein [Nitrospira sp.]MBX3348950.1 hypothetical protein [Nitrospira sp.]
MATVNQGSKSSRLGTVVVTVLDGGGSRAPITNAKVSLHRAGDSTDTTSIPKNWTQSSENLVRPIKRTNSEGRVVYDGLQAGCYGVIYGHYPETDPKYVAVHAGCTKDVCIEVNLNLQIVTMFLNQDCKPISCPRPRKGDKPVSEVIVNDPNNNVGIIPPHGFKVVPDDPRKFTGPPLKAGPLKIAFRAALLERTDLPIDGGGDAEMLVTDEHDPPDDAPVVPIGGNVGATLSRTATEPTDDLALWGAIRNSTDALSFNNYLRFMDWIFCGKDDRSSLKAFERSRFAGKRQQYLNLRDRKRFLPFTDSDAYRVVKAATEAFVMVNCGVHGEHPPFTEEGDRDRDEDYLGRRDLPTQGLDFEKYLETVDGTTTLPYLAVIRRKLPDIPIKDLEFGEESLTESRLDNCFGILQEKLANPCFLELIWSYWHEEGMLVQTVNAISRRFQNVRGPSLQDPLSNLEMDPLRPLNNLLWGYIQDEQHRLTVARRNYEYDHHYGLRLEGQAVQQFRPVDTRSKFLEAFHHLLRLCTVFYKQDDDTTVKADAFPVLNALKETHLILSQGAHNQFGDLPSTARIEMLMQEWLLARPEFREALPTRIMVAYPEPWMDRVDAMKRVQGWTDTSVLHFRNLGLFGEQLLLAIRWGHWSDVQEPIQAFNWARFFRPQVQGYIHAYRAVTGVDLTTETVDTKVDATLPSVLLKRRLALQQRAS